MSDATATLDRGDPEPFIVIESPGGRRSLKDDLLPMIALLGVVYGWAFALLMVLIAVVVLIVR